METTVLTILVPAVLPLHEQLINVPEPSRPMCTAPPYCSYIKRNCKKKMLKMMAKKEYRKGMSDLRNER
jgi:hypothetical protein